MITLVTDRLICQTSLVKWVKTLVDSNRIDQVILREKDLSDKALYDLYCQMTQVLKDTSINLIVNASLEFSQKYSVNKIHLSQKNFKKITHKTLVKEIYFGVSVHSITEIKSALSFEPSYLLVSPIFKTPCKSDKEALGIDFFKRVKEITNIPIIALGGINDQNINQLKKANFSNIAMRSSLMV